MNHATEWVADHQLGAAEIAAVARVLSSRSVTTGPEVAAFERELAAHFGVDDVLAVASCTAAMHLALLAYGIGAGDEVITTPLTFPATCNVILAVGATPVFADVNPETLNLDPAAVAGAITSRTRAVMPVHLGGAACDMADLRAVARDLPIIADSAHAVDSYVNGVHVARLADVSCFSFYATKNLTSVEGGAVVGPPEVLDRCRLLARHGLRFAWDGSMSATAASYTPEAVGHKYNLTDVHAAIGRVQLARLPELQKARRSVVEVYDEAIGGYAEIAPPARESVSDHGWYLYQARLTGPDGAARRAAVARDLAAAKVAVGAYYRPLHAYDLYQRLTRRPVAGLPVAEDAFTRLLALPLHARMTPELAARVAARLIRAIERASA